MDGRSEVSKRRSPHERCALQIPNRVSKLIVSIHVSCLSNRRDHPLDVACICADRQAVLRTSEGQGTPDEAASKRVALP